LTESRSASQSLKRFADAHDENRENEEETELLIGEPRSIR
jgi:hypothetical protein